ncbi:sigma-54 interaction domain-containing protein [Noviherbaspirillum saxi]|nr:sigma 54-interacting transcriptional regulator [Noviherbaspirillum saxi]
MDRAGFLQHAFSATLSSDALWAATRNYMLRSHQCAGFLVLSRELTVLDSNVSKLGVDAFSKSRTGADLTTLPESLLDNLKKIFHEDPKRAREDTGIEFVALDLKFHIRTIAINNQTVGAFIWITQVKTGNATADDVIHFAASTLEILTSKFSVEQEKTWLIKEQQAIVDHITDGLLVIERSGVVRFMNATAGRILNLVPKKSIGQRFSDLLDFEPIIHPIFESGVGYVDRELIIDSPRRHLHLIDTAVPIKNAQGQVVSIVNSFREIHRVRKIADRLQGNHARYTFESLIGSSESLQDATAAAHKAARGFANVLLNGESGVGKEVFAQAIHNGSSRVDGPFIAINCAALPRDLIESELFGYTSGSFTGARKEGRPGKFESATGGTIFLDEISELPLDVQAKLLRVLQEREVVRIGDTRGIPIDVRIISACNRDLRQLVQTKEFREDLFYRFNVIAITIPPLRKRQGDIAVLANHFLTKYAALLGKRTYRFQPSVLEKMMKYEWPGNVRELENCVERIVNLCDEEEVSDIYFSELDVAHALPESRQSGTLKSLRDAERDAIEAMLQACNCNITESARRLGISKPTLYAKIREHGVIVERAIR